MAMRGFWNDPDGLTIDEFAALMVLPLFLFTGVKLALAKDITATQVDFFTVLTYPILAVVARRAVENFGWPLLGRKGIAQGYSQVLPPAPVQTANAKPAEPLDFNKPI
jgi:hypothetical protein